VDKPTQFGFPVFVIWRLVDRKPKERVVVDLRDLNKDVIEDSYPLPKQENILSFDGGAKYLTVVDAAQLFYQWAVHPGDWDKFAVNSHRGQSLFTVAPMGFCNSPAPSRTNSASSRLRQGVRRRHSRSFLHLPGTRAAPTTVIPHTAREHGDTEPCKIFYRIPRRSSARSTR
jgi:hypothetical protein